MGNGYGCLSNSRCFTPVPSLERETMVGNEEKNKLDSITISHSCQSALANLSSSRNLAGFVKQTEEVLRLCVVDAVDVLVCSYNSGSESLKILNSQDNNDTEIFLPKTFSVKNVLQDKRPVTRTSFKNDEKLLDFLPKQTETSSCHVTFSPVIDENGDVLLLIVITCKSPLKSDTQSSLSFYQHMILNTYKQVTRRHSQDEKLGRYKEFLQTFCNDFETDMASFSKKIVQYTQKQTLAGGGVLLGVDSVADELYFHGAGKNGSVIEKRLEIKGSSFADILKSKQIMNMEFVKEGLAQGDFQNITDEPINSLLCAPILDKEADSVVALLCLYNKQGGDESRFNEHDEDSVKFVSKHSAKQLIQTLRWEKANLLQRQQDHLLKVARNLFMHMADVTELLHEIMEEARSLTQAERCSLFLLDKDTNELVAKVFDGGLPSDNGSGEWRMPSNQGIAGLVATTGTLLNIKDAYAHPLFYRGVDTATGFRTRNILCFPIMDEKGVLGVAELCNKINGTCFTKFDEDLTKAFAIFCGISIVHSLLYKKVLDAQQRSKVARELMLHYMKVPDNEVVTNITMKPPSKQEFAEEFDCFVYMPRAIEDKDTTKATLLMFEDMGLIKRWHISLDKLSRFSLMVKRGYRDPPYHNWTHAFTVAHFCYLLFKNLDNLSLLREIEIFALFVSCLCHDLDHRGTNNAFQVTSNSPLAALYSSQGSVLERHHFAQAVCILHSEGCNIFDNLSSEEYKEVLDLMKDIILATDLGHHLKIIKNQQAMAKKYDKDNRDHRHLLLYLLMTSCDLSDQTKPWESSSKTAELVYAEFFSQGEMEKALGQTPSESMDRERASIPKLQIDFIRHIVLPVYKILCEMFPSCQILVDTIEGNRKLWEIQHEEGLKIQSKETPSESDAKR